MAVASDTVVVGAYSEDSAYTGPQSPGPSDQPGGADMSGAAYVFRRAGNTWTQEAYLKAANTSAEDRFGSTVAISDGAVVVGALYEDSVHKGPLFPAPSAPPDGADQSGAVYVFQ